MRGSRSLSGLWKNAMPSAVYLGSAMLAMGQGAPAAASDPVEALRVQMEQLRMTLKEMNDQLADTRR